MDETCATPGAIELPNDKAKNGRPTQYDEKLGVKIIDAVRAGFTLERAAEYVGIIPGTAQGWVSKRQDFGRLIKKARREHEMSLLRSVELAGEKSWQARAWILERTHGYAQPSARLAVTQEHTHGISSNLASLLAGIAGRKKTQVIDAKTVEVKTALPIRDNTYCATDGTQTIVTPTPGKIPRPRKLSMRRRKPRKESLAKYTTTPPASPPAPI